MKKLLFLVSTSCMIVSTVFSGDQSNSLEQSGNPASSSSASSSSLAYNPVPMSSTFKIRNDDGSIFEFQPKADGNSFPKLLQNKSGNSFELNLSGHPKTYILEYEKNREEGVLYALGAYERKDISDVNKDLLSGKLLKSSRSFMAISNVVGRDINFMKETNIFFYFDKRIEILEQYKAANIDNTTLVAAIEDQLKLQKKFQEKIEQQTQKIMNPTKTSHTHTLATPTSTPQAPIPYNQPPKPIVHQSTAVPKLPGLPPLPEKTTSSLAIPNSNESSLPSLDWKFYAPVKGTSSNHKKFEVYDDDDDNNDIFGEFEIAEGKDEVFFKFNLKSHPPLGEYTFAKFWINGKNHSYYKLKLGNQEYDLRQTEAYTKGQSTILKIIPNTVKTSSE